VYRFERKFRSNLYDIKDLVSLVRSNCALFVESYPPRVVNSIYLDTTSYSFVQDNLAGISSRVKPRIRWYGDQQNKVSDGVLELKYKKNQLGRKDSYFFGPVVISKKDFRDQLSKTLISVCNENPKLRFLRELDPSLMTTYIRRYFESADRKFRITIDTDVRYWAFSAFGLRSTRPYIDHGLIILELKYDQSTTGIEEVIKEFPFRFSRCSKYVTGILST